MKKQKLFSFFSRCEQNKKKKNLFFRGVFGGVCDFFGSFFFLFCRFANMLTHVGSKDVEELVLDYFVGAELPFAYDLLLIDSRFLCAILRRWWKQAEKTGQNKAQLLQFVKHCSKDVVDFVSAALHFEISCKSVLLNGKYMSPYMLDRLCDWKRWSFEDRAAIVYKSGCTDGLAAHVFDSFNRREVNQIVYDSRKKDCDLFRQVVKLVHKKLVFCSPRCKHKFFQWTVAYSIGVGHITHATYYDTRLWEACRKQKKENIQFIWKDYCAFCGGV
jgi:hypothetical protein